jgi:hypothetical protein
MGFRGGVCSFVPRVLRNSGKIKRELNRVRLGDDSEAAEKASRGRTP